MSYWLIFLLGPALYAPYILSEERRITVKFMNSTSAQLNILKINELKKNYTSLTPYLDLDSIQENSSKFFQGFTTDVVDTSVKVSNCMPLLILL